MKNLINKIYIKRKFIFFVIIILYLPHQNVFLIFFSKEDFKESIPSKFYPFIIFIIFKKELANIIFNKKYDGVIFNNINNNLFNLYLILL